MKNIKASAATRTLRVGDVVVLAENVDPSDVRMHRRVVGFAQSVPGLLQGQHGGLITLNKSFDGFRTWLASDWRLVASAKRRVTTRKGNG